MSNPDGRSEPRRTPTTTWCPPTLPVTRERRRLRAERERRRFVERLRNTVVIALSILFLGGVTLVGNVRWTVPLSTVKQAR